MGARLRRTRRLRPDRNRNRYLFFARKLLRFTGMRDSVSQSAARYVAEQPECSFLAVRDFRGTRTAVESAFSRLAASGDLSRVRNGIYWKGVSTPWGMTLPRTEEVAVTLGGLGSGPAGIAAAHWLGLTSQVPSTYLTAVPGRVPTPWRHVRFTQRPIGRLLAELSPSEVAVLEVLRSGPAVVESSWSEFGSVVFQLSAEGQVRLPALQDAVQSEPHRDARARWAELCRARSESAPTT